MRLALTVLRNFLTHKVFAEQVVELGVLEVVQALEYEKWRDSDMYDDIRDMSSQISLKAQRIRSARLGQRRPASLVEQRRAFFGPPHCSRQILSFTSSAVQC